MSFKYRFILSFVLLEALFIFLIVTVNFVAIKDSSTKLTSEKIESNITFLEELVKVPLSIYDLASLDNIVENAQTLDYINSILILDANNKIVSESFQYKHQEQDLFMKAKLNAIKEFDDNVYALRYEEIFEDETFLGAIYLVFDLSENENFIRKNKTNTIFIVIIEILLSTLAAYFIGSRLTKMLTNLSDVAQIIGADKKVDIPYLDKKDEIGLLSNSMNQMQEDLSTRNQKLKDLAIILKKQKDELVQANQSKDDFLANMSHELKTPLNSINVISSVMMKNKKGKLDEEQVKNLSIINSCGNDLLYLINDVLDISKLEAGQIELHNETVNLKTTMDSIQSMFAPQVEAKGLSFEYSFSSAIEYIYSDEVRIKQVVKNLLSNALKFVQDGGIRLKVQDSESNIIIIVEDDGIGIPKQKLGHIFDRFKQADESTTRKFGGTGLGLAISKELVELLEGTISVESEENVGTVFTVVLPKNSEQLDTSHLPNLAKTESSAKVALFYTDVVGMMERVIELKKEFQLLQSNSVKVFEESLSQECFAIILQSDRSLLEDLVPLLEKTKLPIVILTDEPINLEIYKTLKVTVLPKDVDSKQLIDVVLEFKI